LPEDHLVYFVGDLIDELDLSAIMTVYEDEERWFPPYHPVMLTKVLVYAYCVGIFSSRRIQRRLAEDVGFRVLAAGNRPDFRTIADSRRTHVTALTGFFEQVLRRRAKWVRCGSGAWRWMGQGQGERVEAQGHELADTGSLLLERTTITARHQSPPSGAAISSLSGTVRTGVKA
jgi:transposase-like protein DUF772